MFEQLPGHHIKRISVDKLERRNLENQATLERLAVADDGFIERAAQLQAASQPDVIRYLVEALHEEGDPDLKLTEDEKALVFHVLTTVVEVLDNACKKTRWR